MKQHLKQAHEGHPKAILSSGHSRKKGQNASTGSNGGPEGALPEMADLVAAAAAGVGIRSVVNEDDLPPSTLILNPFRTLSDPADMEGKISSIKESGSRC